MKTKFVKMKLTKVQVVQLIKLYRSHELLWNMKIPEYRRSDLRTEALDDISKKMGFPVDMVKRKLRALRCTYNMDRNKRIVAAEASKPVGKTVFWFNEMKFLDTFLDQGEESFNNVSQTTYDSSSNLEEYLEDDQWFESSEFIDQIKKENSPLSQLKLIKRRKSETSDEAPPQFRPMKRSKTENTSTSVAPLEQVKVIDSNGLDNNDFTAFATSVGCQLQSLPEEDAYTLMGEIQNLLSQCKLKNLRKRASSAPKPLSVPPTKKSIGKPSERLTRIPIERLTRSSTENLTSLPTKRLTRSPTFSRSASCSSGDPLNGEVKCTPNQSSFNSIEVKQLESELGELLGEEVDEAVNEPKKKGGIVRKYWVKPPLVIKRSPNEIEADLLKDLFWQDHETDMNTFSHINIHQFEEVLSLVHDSLKKKETFMRAPIPPRTKLAITLRYLGIGDSYMTMEKMTNVSAKTIGGFIPEVMRAICASLQSTYLKVPDSPEEWRMYADDFESIWQFPHVLGAIDGKHIHVRSSPNNKFFKVKGFFTVILFALVDAHSRFTFIDFNDNGKATDSTIYQDGALLKTLERGDLNIPKPSVLVEGEVNKLPYFFIGDDTFQLNKHLMKPFSRTAELREEQEVFNYRICRGTLAVDSAFSKLAKRFNIFKRPIEAVSIVDPIVRTCCVLHNYLTRDRTTAMPSDFEVESIPPTFSPIGEQRNFSSENQTALRIRDELSEYFVTDGNVDFQWAS